jgi:hypothetical protein
MAGTHPEALHDKQKARSLPFGPYLAPFVGQKAPMNQGLLKMNLSPSPHLDLRRK